MDRQVLDGAAHVDVPRHGSVSLLAEGLVETGGSNVDARHGPASRTGLEEAAATGGAQQDTVTSTDVTPGTDGCPPTATGAATRAARFARRGRRALLRPTVQLTAANIGAQALSMLSGLLIARQLGAIGRGQVSLVQVYDEASTNAASLGTPTATGYFAKERPSSEAAILGAALTISAFSLPITALLGWIVATFIFADAPVGIQLIVWCAIGLTPLANSFPMACRMLFAARGEISSLVPLQIAQMVLRVAAMLALIAVGAPSLPTAVSASLRIATAPSSLRERQSAAQRYEARPLSAAAC